MSYEASNTRGFRSRKDAGEIVDDGGAWMNEGAKVAEFLTWFTSEPEAEAPLKNMVMISSPSTGGSDKNTLRMVSKQFKDDAEEGTRSIKWKGPGVNDDSQLVEGEADDELSAPSSLWSIIAVRDRYGGIKDRLPDLKSIDCNGLGTLMDLNGCPRGLEVFSCNDCNLVQSLAPLAACTNLRKISLLSTNVSNLKPLMSCLKLEYLALEASKVTDLGPLASCLNLRALWMAVNPVSDLSPLSGLHQLRLLDLETTQVSDLSPLSSLTCLETLVCGDTKISDLTPLSKCSELKALDISATEVKSLTPLLQCNKLKYLNHGDFDLETDPDETDQELLAKASTDGYIRLFKEMMPGLECSRMDSMGWMWANPEFPADLQHDWDKYP